MMLILSDLRDVDKCTQLFQYVKINRVRSAHLSPGLPTGLTREPGLGFKPYFGKSGEYWVIKYFKCSDVQNCANWWILRQVR